MSNSYERKTIHLPEVCRVEGHEAVTVEISDTGECKVQLEVFEGTRFFERIVVGHSVSEIPHITSRVCAICSTGHILAAAFALESGVGFQPSLENKLLRELMHMGMFIESHSTHIFALALPDFLGAKDLGQFATEHTAHFKSWTRLRELGAAIQTCLGGRPFHPVNLQVGGFSHYPSNSALKELDARLAACMQTALDICEFLMTIKPAVCRKTEPRFLSLLQSRRYGFFGDTVRCTDGWDAPISDYKEYLAERVVPFSHAKRADANGTPIMVGAMARLRLFSDLLESEAGAVYSSGPLAKGDHNSIWNNLAQAIEIVQCIEKSRWNIYVLTGEDFKHVQDKPLGRIQGEFSCTGAVECPRGTLYHSYSVDAEGRISAADMVTPSVQNTERIELDIKEVVMQSTDHRSPELQNQLETLIRAYDPCNTCATHMVKVKYSV